VKDELLRTKDEQERKKILGFRLRRKRSIGKKVTGGGVSGDQTALTKSSPHPT
jgi:hypothetical protein